VSFSDVADCGCGVTLSLLLLPEARVEEHSLVPLGKARLGRIGFDEWLGRSQAGA
jgi:hypothetical protein